MKNLHHLFRHSLIISCATLGLAAVAPGCEAAPAAVDDTPPTPVAAAVTDPGTALPTTADAWLSRLEEQASERQSLTARVRMRSIQGLLEDETTRFGDFAYTAAADDQPPCFAVRFDRLKLDDAVEPIEQAYIFDGRWLLDIDTKAKTATRRELTAQDDNADPDMLGLGEGPFPVPLNLNKARVLARFDVTLIEPDEEDDPQGSAQGAGNGTVHLQLKPRENVDIDSVKIDLWFLRDIGLPVRAATLQEDEDQTIIDLFNAIPNAKIKPKTFDTTLPTAKGWDTQNVPLEE